MNGREDIHEQKMILEEKSRNEMSNITKLTQIMIKIK